MFWIKLHIAVVRRWIEVIWQIKTTLAHEHGRAVLLRRLLADRQVSPTGLAFVPMLIETAIAELHELHCTSCLSTISNQCLAFRECVRPSLVLFHWTRTRLCRIARTPRTGLTFSRRAVGAVVAQLLYTETVVGSNPSSPTSLRSPLRCELRTAGQRFVRSTAENEGCRVEVKRRRATIHNFS